MITGMPRIAIAARNFTQLLGLFRDKFHMPVLDLSEMSRKEYGAALAMCVPEGGSNIELMSPVDPDTPLCRSLQGFIDRRGEGLFALMLEAPVPDEEAEQLAARGLNVMPLMPGAFGRDVHPSSTHGVLIRVYPVNSFKGRHQGEPDRRAPQLSGIVRVIVAVARGVHKETLFPLDERTERYLRHTFRQDIAASKAHVAMLGAQGIRVIAGAGDATRAPHRILTSDRYRSMEAAFAVRRRALPAALGLC